MRWFGFIKSLLLDLVFKATADVKVDYLVNIIMFDDVLRLDIPMRNVHFLKTGEDGDHLFHQRNNLFLTKLLPFLLPPENLIR